VKSPRGAEDEEPKFDVDLDEQSLGTDSTRFTAGRGGLLRGMGRRMVAVLVGDLFAIQKLANPVQNFWA
jgi:hypothetical protein